MPRPSSRRQISGRISGAAFYLALVASVGLSPAPLALAQAAPSANDLSSRNDLASSFPSFAPLVKRVMPAVVNISTSAKSGGLSGNRDQFGPRQDPFQGFPPSPFDQLLRRFFNGQGPDQLQPFAQTQRTTLGSGFIIDPSGYIVTNNHVIQNAGKVTVIFQDGTKHSAKIIGSDTKTDLALLKIDAPTPLPAVSWGDSDAEQVGDWVLAVGNPFGLGGTVSPGTIAARGRDIGAGPYDDFLQIDASINRGNSGGPSFNLAGQVIGINTAIYSPNGGSVGIGFAIPSNLAKSVIEQLRAHGKIERGWLGVQIQEVTPALAKSLGLPKEEGALVSSVTPDSPAAEAGFKEGDVILAFDGHAIDKMRDLPIVVAETAVGHKAEVSLWRGGAAQTLEPVIAKLPANPEIAQREGGDSVAGLTFTRLTESWRQRLQVPDSVRGVVVASVADDSPLAELGLETGDVVEAINQKPVTTPAEAVAAINAAQSPAAGAHQILLLLNRHGVNEYVAMSIAGDGTG